MTAEKKVSRRAWIAGAGAVAAAAVVAGAAGYLYKPAPGPAPTQTVTQTGTGATIIRTETAPLGKPIRIGVPIPQTGPYAIYGMVMLEGANQAQKEVNAAGGVLGRPVELLVRDTEAKPDVASRKVKAMIEVDKIDAIDGVLSSAVNFVINDLVKQPAYRIPFMCANMTEITMHDTKVRAGMTAFPMTVNIASSLATIGGANKIWPNAKYYILDVDYVWGHEMRDSVLAAMKQFGGTEIGVDYFPLGTTDYSALLTSAKRAKPDVLLLIVGGSDAINCAKQIQEFGLAKEMNILFPMTQWITAYQAGGTKVYNGIYAGCDWVFNVGDAGFPWSDRAKKFSDDFLAAMGHPADPYTMGTYVGLHEYAAACERAGSTDPDKVIAALAGHQFEYHKGPETWRPCDLQAIQDWFIIKGIAPEEAKNEFDIFRVISKAGYDNPDFYFGSPASLGCK